MIEGLNSRNEALSLPEHEGEPEQSSIQNVVTDIRGRLRERALQEILAKMNRQRVPVAQNKPLFTEDEWLKYVEVGPTEYVRMVCADLCLSQNVRVNTPVGQHIVRLMRELDMGNDNGMKDRELAKEVERLRKIPDAERRIHQLHQILSAAQEM